VLQGVSCSLGVSIGIALNEADDEPEAVLLAADRAMYEAKEAGRGRYVTAPGPRMPQAPVRPFIRA
jgi:GGDEF domain-containing protein